MLRQTFRFLLVDSTSTSDGARDGTCTIGFGREGPTHDGAISWTYQGGMQFQPNILLQWSSVGIVISFASVATGSDVLCQKCHIQVTHRAQVNTLQTRFAE